MISQEDGMTAGEREQVLLAKWRTLPADKQQEILDLVDFLQHKIPGRRPRRSLLGLGADLKVDVTEEDLAQARREMWGKFPRNLPS
jgi:hypothetical protein